MQAAASMTAEPSSDYGAALAAIRQSGLKHPDGPLLESFIDDCLDRDRAAAFLRKRLFTDANTPELNIRAFLADWKRIIAIFVRDGVCEASDRSVITKVTQRDGGKCFITGLSGSFWDPLVVVPILPRVKLAAEDIAASSIREMLGAFLTPELSDRLLSKTEESYHGVKNHWLLRKSAASAFAQGYFQISLYRKSKYEVLKVLIDGPHRPPTFDQVEDFRRGFFSDASSSGINMPNRWALKVLSQFATPLRWTHIAQEIATKQHKQSCAATLPSPSLFSDTLTTIFKTIWRLVPGPLRIRAYLALASLGARIYGPTDSFNVQQLPFGLYLKVLSSARREGLVNEHATLELVRRHTDIPVPRALDLVSDSTDIYLLTTRVPGYKLGLCIATMSDEDTAALVRDLRRHMVALRAVPRPAGWRYAISSAVDGPCFDYRINAALNYDEARGEVVGPFLSEDDFIDTLRCEAIPGVVHRGGHEMVFTHGDLNLRNVLVDDQGRLTGIIDWENAGWFPEYWDYTKALFVTKFHHRWLGMVDDVFRQFGDFGYELGIERELWNYCF